VDLEESVLGLVEAGYVFKLGRLVNVKIFSSRCTLLHIYLRQATFGVIRPSMIPATQDETAALFLLRHGVCAMAADIVEGPELLILAEDDKEGKGSDIEGEVVARLVEARTVSREKPLLRRVRY